MMEHRVNKKTSFGDFKKMFGHFYNGYHPKAKEEALIRAYKEATGNEPASVSKKSKPVSKELGKDKE